MISDGYSYKVKYVAHRTTKTGKNITAFSIGDKVKDSNPTEYVNWQVTVWSNLDLVDGQSFKVEKIVNISFDTYNGKRQCKLTLEGTPVTGNDDEFTPPQDEPVRRSNTVTDTGKQAEPFFPGVDDDPGFKMPFDV